MRFFTSVVVAAIILVGSVTAHPGHDISQELAERAAFLKTSKRDLSHCSAKMRARGIEQRAIRRRGAAYNDIRAKRDIDSPPHLKVRNDVTVLRTSHLSNESYDTSTDEETVFAGVNACILSPEVTQGPYYASGEDIRYDLIEDQEGVELFLDMQVFDMATCEPVVNAMIDIWNCNSTGVYGGIVASGNGDSSDETNINNKFLRGLQPTDTDGVAKFETLVPGHYTGRTNHIHVLVHLNGTVLSNDTYVGGTYSHVGQLFFDQDLVTEVEATEPYASNTQTLTTNKQDSIFLQEAASSDPIVEYSLLGETVADGLFAWVAFGINTTYSTTFTPAASCYADGCVENASGGGGPGGAPPNGTNGTFPGGPF